MKENFRQFFYARIFRLACIIYFLSLFLWYISCFIHTFLHLFMQQNYFILLNWRKWLHISYMSPSKRCVWGRSWAGKEWEKMGQMLRSRRDSLHSGRGKNVHLPTRVYKDYGCDYVQLSSDRLAEIDEHRIWWKSERVGTKETAIGRKVDGICATRSGHVVKTMTVKTF